MSVKKSDSVAGVADPASAESWLGAWEASADPAYCRDLDGHVLAANLSFARKFGKSTEKLVGARVVDFVHPDDAEKLRSVVAELSRPPHAAVSEHRWMTPQGIRWFSWEKVALRDEHGIVVAIRAVGRDITRQRLAEEQFYRLSRAVEQSPVSIVITDLEGNAQYVNSKFTAVSGNTLEDIIDRRINVLRDGHPDEASYQKFWETIRAGGEWRGELSTERGKHSIVWESVKVSCLRSPGGEITNYLCLREDVSERKKLEHDLRQAHKMESLGTLAGGIAHDFNNLLAIINGYAEVCMLGSADPKLLQKGLREIRSAVQRATGLVRQILTFSRKAEASFAPVELNQLVRDLVTMLSETFPRTITFNMELLEPLPPLRADQNQLQQIILNLCVNARDAMPQGGTITVATSVHAGSELGRHEALAGSSYACLKVSDAGMGMNEEVRARIFEPFFTTKQGNQGTGLGLAVVYGIVVGHHGFIEVDSAPGAGSTFSVFLPMSESAVAPVLAQGSTEFPSGTERLLIVDDEEPLRDLLCRAFMKKGYSVVSAANGLEAIEIIGDTQRQFDLVLLDLNMPGADGLQVLKVIRACRPNIKVLVISGHITSDMRAKFKALGQDDWLQKPYALDDIGRRLRVLLDSAPRAAA
jgi:two-component system, cell cycle sensor histidine kinase and response regulator CckA